MTGHRILLLDNRDSFVWNLAQALQLLGCDVDVLRSDRIDVPEIERTHPDAIVMSPGPGQPADAGCCETVVRTLHARIPMLGVCLGHQAIASAFGASVERAAPRHGKTSSVRHGDTGLFAGLPNPFEACRYHSLTVDPETLPEDLTPQAWAGDGTLMAVAHTTHPVFGVQFHPESFRTQHGLRLLGNFLENC